MKLQEMLHLDITEDKMTVQLWIKLLPEGRRFSIHDLNGYLSESGIVYGINQELIQTICEDPLSFLATPVTIAEGVKPIEGKDAIIEYLFPQNRAEIPKEMEDGKVDFYNIDNVMNVEAGQLLIIKHPPTEGVDGKNVFGTIVKGRAGRNFPIKIGKNVVLDELGERVYAAIDGQVVYTEKERINVFPIFEVNGDVDFRVGNIDFVGMVVIRGNVLSGFKIKAQGDVRILGEVEAAEIVAGGNVEIRAGIAGQGKGTISAGGDVITNYINQAYVSAEGDVIVAQSIMHSEVHAGRNVICTKSRGLIVGGHIIAGEQIKANYVGNQTFTHTTLEVGVTPSIVKDYNENEEKLKFYKQEIEKANKGLATLELMVSQSGPLSPEREELKRKLIQMKATIEADYAVRLEKKYEFEDILNRMDSGTVEVYKIAYPRTRIVFGKYTRHLRVEQSRAQFRFAKGEIAVLPL